MVHAPKENPETKDGNAYPEFSNPVDATYTNPEQSYPQETEAAAPDTDDAISTEADSKSPAPKNPAPKKVAGYSTVANPVDPSYAPATYASMSKVEPTAKLADAETPPENTMHENTMNPPLSNGPTRHETSHHEAYPHRTVSPNAHIAPALPRTVHRDTAVTHSIPSEHPHGVHAAMVAWSAIAAGTVISASTSLILLFLASAMGLASISPWSQAGASAQAFSFGAAIVLILMQCLSSGLGGYLTGRLRSKWINMMPDEVFFRDTAHGFLSWGLATLLTAGVLASAATSAINTGAAAVTTGAALSMADVTNRDGSAQNPQTYFTDKLFRGNQINAAQLDVRTQANGILLSALINRTLPETDRAYLTELVSGQTGLSTNDASQRIRDVLSQMDAAEQAVRQHADTMRKAASSIALFTFLSLLMGAFVACIGSALGGHHRDKI